MTVCWKHWNSERLNLSLTVTALPKEIGILSEHINLGAIKKLRNSYIQIQEEGAFFLSKQITRA